MSPDRVQALRALCEKATPFATVLDGSGRPVAVYYVNPVARDAFIAACREAVPHLLDALDSATESCPVPRHPHLFGALVSPDWLTALVQTVRRWLCRHHHHKWQGEGGVGLSGYEVWSGCRYCGTIRPGSLEVL